MVIRIRTKSPETIFAMSCQDTELETAVMGMKCVPIKAQTEGMKGSITPTRSIQDWVMVGSLARFRGLKGSFEGTSRYHQGLGLQAMRARIPPEYMLGPGRGSYKRYCREHTRVDS